jgi:hypothetical protein
LRAMKRAKKQDHGNRHSESEFTGKFPL